MGCFGSSEQKENSQPQDAGSTKQRRHSKFATDVDTPQVVALPEPDKALPETTMSKKICDAMESILDKKLKVKMFRGILDLENFSFEEYEGEELEAEDYWKDFGRIPLVTTAKSIKLGYTDFNRLEECANFVNCRKLNFESCDFEKADFKKAKFPKLLQELNITESQFQAWDALKELEYLKTLIASGMDEEVMPSEEDSLPKCLTDVDLGASEFDWKILRGLPNLERVDLKGVESDLSGKCPLPTTLKYLDVEETNFDDVDFLKSLDDTCTVLMDAELKAKLS